MGFGLNERDELQRQLRRLEDESAQKISNLTTQLAAANQQINELTSQLHKVELEKQSLDNKISSLRFPTCTAISLYLFSAQVENQASNIEGKATNIIKLREIARKYRQEAEVLKQEKSMSTSTSLF
ncbi:unnamed protein product [Protopolystoma xenopodis]|uniref:Myosin tail domain-containing protein n=1 Tax=Protopolystoma xenopodis TaxID=117903 RepID=A0A448XCR0_9PLAT|nr:unnamed protein product [Protopolystoma xenopodis]